MRSRADKIVDQVPASVSEVQVMCYDHVAQLYVMSAWWPDVRDFLRGQINGYQLGARVFTRVTP